MSAANRGDNLLTPDKAGRLVDQVWRVLEASIDKDPAPIQQIARRLVRAFTPGAEFRANSPVLLAAKWTPRDQRECIAGKLW